MAAFLKRNDKKKTLDCSSVFSDCQGQEKGTSGGDSFYLYGLKNQPVKFP